MSSVQLWNSGTDGLCPGCASTVPFGHLLQHLVRCLGIGPGAPIVIVVPAGVGNHVDLGSRTQQLAEGIYFDPSAFALDVAGQGFHLTCLENSLLSYFVRHANEVLTRSGILAAVWTHDSRVLPREVDAYVLRLRKRLRNHPSGEALISTIHGVGYRMNLPVKGSVEGFNIG